MNYMIIVVVVIIIFLICFVIGTRSSFLSSHYPHPEYFLTGKKMYVPRLPDYTSKKIM